MSDGSIQLSTIRRAVDWLCDTVIREREAELSVAFDQLHQAGWPLESMYLVHSRGEKMSGQTTTMMLRACSLWMKDTAMFEVAWEFTDDGVTITRRWLRSPPECPPNVANYFIDREALMRGDRRKP